MSTGWGVRAASRMKQQQQQHDQDELLQSLGTQFNVDFSSYDQWQRKDKKKPQTRSPTSKGLDEEFIVERPVNSPITYKERKQMKVNELEKKKSERTKIIELRIKTRKRTLRDYQHRRNQLIQDNMKLQTEIEESEGSTHDTVKGFLRRYEKLRSGMTNITGKFTEELDESLHNLKETKNRLADRLSHLEERVKVVDDKLQGEQGIIQVLNSYKDKEYPVKAMEITNLQKRIENLKVTNQEDQGDLEHIISMEIGKVQKDRIQILNDTTHKAKERAVAKMHPSLRDMAMQNIVMKKEIEFHQKEETDLLDAIKILKHEIRRLIKDPKTNVRLQVFPEFYPEEEKCSPDMDIVLDIPTHQWLPL